MQMVLRRDLKDKYSRLQERRRALTKLIKTAELQRNLRHAELLFQQKADLVARLRECYREAQA